MVCDITDDVGANPEPTLSVRQTTVGVKAAQSRERRFLRGEEQEVKNSAITRSGVLISERL